MSTNQLMRIGLSATTLMAISGGLGAGCDKNNATATRVTNRDAASDAVFSRRPIGGRGARDAASTITMGPDAGPSADVGAGAVSTADAAPAAPASAAPWTSKDIGVTGDLKSSLAVTPTIFTAKAAGKGVGGMSDSFFFTSQKISGDFELVAKVRSMQLSAPLAQAGFMVRANDSDPAAANVFVFSFGDPVMGGNIQVREKTGGMTTAVLPMNDPNLKPSSFVRIVREGKRFSVYRTLNRQSWTRVAVVDLDLPAEVFVGAAAATASETALLTTEFDFMKISNLDTRAATRGTLVEDLGTMGGAALYDGKVMTVTGYGQTISATQEFGTYLVQPASGSQSVTVRVDKVDGPNPQSRIGIMVRDGQALAMSRSAMHAMMAVTKERGVEFQTRSAQGGNTVFGMKKEGIAFPLWIRLEKIDEATGSAAKFVGSFSRDGVTFETLDSATLTFPEPYLLGYLVNANATNGLATATIAVIDTAGTPPPRPIADAGAPADVRPRDGK